MCQRRDWTWLYYWRCQHGKALSPQEQRRQQPLHQAVSRRCAVEQTRDRRTCHRGARRRDCFSPKQRRRRRRVGFARRWPASFRHRLIHHCDGKNYLAERHRRCPSSGACRYVFVGHRRLQPRAGPIAEYLHPPAGSDRRQGRHWWIYRHRYRLQKGARARPRTFLGGVRRSGFPGGSRD